MLVVLLAPGTLAYLLDEFGTLALLKCNCDCVLHSNMQLHEHCLNEKGAPCPTPTKRLRTTSGNNLGARDKDHGTVASARSDGLRTLTIVPDCAAAERFTYSFYTGTSDAQVERGIRKCIERQLHGSRYRLCTYHLVSPCAYGGYLEVGGALPHGATLHAHCECVRIRGGLSRPSFGWKETIEHIMLFLGVDELEMASGASGYRSGGAAGVVTAGSGNDAGFDARNSGATDLLPWQRRRHGGLLQVWAMCRSNDWWGNVKAGGTDGGVRRLWQHSKAWEINVALIIGTERAAQLRAMLNTANSHSKIGPRDMRSWALQLAQLRTRWTQPSNFDRMVARRLSLKALARLLDKLGYFRPPRTFCVAFDVDRPLVINGWKASLQRSEIADVDFEAEGLNGQEDAEATYSLELHHVLTNVTFNVASAPSRMLLQPLILTPLMVAHSREASCPRQVLQREEWRTSFVDDASGHLRAFAATAPSDRALIVVFNGRYDHTEDCGCNDCAQSREYHDHVQGGMFLDEMEFMAQSGESTWHNL